MKIRRIIFLALLIAISVTYILVPTADVVTNGTLYLIFPIITALIALYTSRIYGFKSSNGRAIRLIATGLVCWGIAEIITFVLYNTDSQTFPSISTAFLLLAFPFFGAGIYQGFMMAGINFKMVNKYLLAVVSSVSLILAILVAYFGVYLVYDQSSDLLTNIAAISLGLGDLVLVIFSLLTVLVASEYKGGKLASFWKTLALGFFIFLIADIVFAINGNEYSDAYDTYFELSWIAAYLLLAFGMLENYVHISTIQKNIKLKLLQRK